MLRFGIIKTIVISLMVFVHVPYGFAAPEPICKREQHDQKYTLKRRKKAGGTYNKRKKAFKKSKTCFKLIGIKYCKD